MPWVRKKSSIHDAQIITSQDDLVFDSFIVTEQNGLALDEIRCEQIQQTLQKELIEPQLKPFSVVKKPIKHQNL